MPITQKKRNKTFWFFQLYHEISCLFIACIISILYKEEKKYIDDKCLLTVKVQRANFFMWLYVLTRVKVRRGLKK